MKEGDLNDSMLHDGRISAQELNEQVGCKVMRKALTQLILE